MSHTAPRSAPAPIVDKSVWQYVKPEFFLSFLKDQGVELSDNNPLLNELKWPLELTISERDTLVARIREANAEQKRDAAETFLRERITLQKAMLNKDVWADFITRFEQGAQTPEMFEEFVRIYKQEYIRLSEDKKLQNFHIPFMRLLGAGYTYDIVGESVQIIGKDGKVDQRRTEALATLPGAAELVRKSVNYLKISENPNVKNARDYVNAKINEYNTRLARTPQATRLEPLTEHILKDEARRNAYLGQILSSNLSDEDKLYIRTYLRDPAGMESTYKKVQPQAAEDKVRRQEGVKIAKEAGIDDITEDDWRNPEQLIGKMIGRMGIWVAPATVYLILNLFGVGHDSLFMKLLLGSTIVGAGKAVGAIDYLVDVATGKKKPLKQIQNIYNESDKNGVIGWVKDLFDTPTSWVKENWRYFETWYGYSNYYANYNDGTGDKAIAIMRIPYDYIRSHIDGNSFDAKFSKDQSALRSNGSEYSNFVKLIKDIDAVGVKNYGEARWKDIRANRTVAEVIEAAHRKDAVPVSGPRPAGAPTSGGSGPAAAVAGAASAVGGAVSAGAGAVADGARKLAGATGLRSETEDEKIAREAREAEEKKKKEEAEKARQEADAKEKALKETEWKNGQLLRDARSTLVRNRKSFVSMIAEDKESRENNVTIETYIRLINNQEIQNGVTLRNVTNYIFDNVSLPGLSQFPKGFNEQYFKKILQLYITGETEVTAQLKNRFLEENKSILEKPISSGLQSVKFLK